MSLSGGRLGRVVVEIATFLNIWLPNTHAVAEPISNERDQSIGKWLGVSPGFFTEDRAMIAPIHSSIAILNLIPLFKKIVPKPVS